MCTLCIKHKKKCVFITGLHYITHTHIHTCLHTFIKLYIQLYINIMYTFEEEKHAITLSGGRITLGPVFILGTPFVQTNGVSNATGSTMHLFLASFAAHIS